MQRRMLVIWYVQQRTIKILRPPSQTTEQPADSGTRLPRGPAAEQRREPGFFLLHVNVLNTELLAILMWVGVSLAFHKWFLVSSWCRTRELPKMSSWDNLLPLGINFYCIKMRQLRGVGG